jgi:hypothetical protein
LGNALTREQEEDDDDDDDDDEDEDEEGGDEYCLINVCLKSSLFIESPYSLVSPVRF